MYPLIAIALSLGLLVVLLRWLKMGQAMMASAVVVAVLLGVTPGKLWQALAEEWQSQPLTQTTPGLFLSLSALLILVNILGLMMKETGVSGRLVPAMQGLFRSRRLALALIPLMMGMLPTPGGIMLSAPMVREPGDRMGMERSHLATINFFFRHQLESVWPIFPAVPLTQAIFSISAFTLVTHNLVLSLSGTAAGVCFLLLRGVPKRDHQETPRQHLGHNLLDFFHAVWPIGSATVLFIAFNVPPAVGIAAATLAFVALHRLPTQRWLAVARQGTEPDTAMLIFGALFFKLNLQTADAIAQVVSFFQDIHLPPLMLIFVLPFLVAFVTGMTAPTVAITFPFLTAFVGTGAEAKVGLEVLAFSGIICALALSPIHLCLAMSVSYFEAPYMKILVRLLGPVACIAGAGFLMALLAG